MLARRGWGALVVGALALSLFPAAVRADLPVARPRPALLVGEIRYIFRGVGVKEPGHVLQPGRVPEGLPQQTLVRTVTNQRATLGFRDGSLLQLNQDTDVVLRSPNLTYVQHGDAEQRVTPGSQHRLEGDATVAAAEGTDYGIQVRGRVNIFFVREGSVLVKNAFGSVYLKNNQMTRVSPGSAPSPPVPFDAKAALTWTKGLPRPASPDINLALDANGGHILSVTSQSRTPVAGRSGNAVLVIDGRLDTGWKTARGRVTNQCVSVGFKKNRVYSLSAIAVDPGPSGHESAGAALKHFTILASTTPAGAAQYTTVLTGIARKHRGLQWYRLKKVKARQVELCAQDNYGSHRTLEVDELEIIGHPASDHLASGGCPFIHTCMDYTLELLNAIRQRDRLPPLILSEALSTGTPSCVGAYGHSAAMAASGQIWHVNSKYRSASYPRDLCFLPRGAQPFEDVARGAKGNEKKAIKGVIDGFDRDQHNVAICKKVVNHACPLVDPAVRWVGIGLYDDARGAWVTLDLV